MLKNRRLTLTLEKPKLDDSAEEPTDGTSFGEKAEVVLEIVERVAVKAFIGLCIYVVFDTYRQTSVERAKHD